MESVIQFEQMSEILHCTDVKQSTKYKQSKNTSGWVNCCSSGWFGGVYFFGEKNDEWEKGSIGEREAFCVGIVKTVWVSCKKTQENKRW